MQKPQFSSLGIKPTIDDMMRAVIAGRSDAVPVSDSDLPALFDYTFHQTETAGVRMSETLLTIGDAAEFTPMHVHLALVITPKGAWRFFANREFLCKSPGLQRFLDHVEASGAPALSDQWANAASVVRRGQGVRLSAALA